MKMTENTPVPPMIVEWVKNIRNKKIGFEIRDNYMTHLSYIRDICNQAINEYNFEKYSHKYKNKR